jgi:hypothetical protein
MNGTLRAEQSADPQQSCCPRRVNRIDGSLELDDPSPFSERRYAFQRSFGVPDGVGADKIEAHFKNGVLTVTLPKRPEAQKIEKKIAIKTA